MSSHLPIGGVGLYLGDVAQVSDAANPAWPPPASSEPAPQGTTAGGAKALLEAQGWMVCDGRQLMAAAFPQLYAALGNRYGGDYASGIFCIPDLRGVFVRGVDNGAGADPDLDARRTPDGKNAYDGVGSMQLDALQTHEHDYGEPAGATIADKGPAAYSIKPDQIPTSGPLPPANVSDNETRSRNVAVYYIIRYA
jgi:rhizosphere induced protein